MSALSSPFSPAYQLSFYHALFPWTYLVAMMLQVQHKVSTGIAGWISNSITLHSTEPICSWPCLWLCSYVTPSMWDYFSMFISVIHTWSHLRTVSQRLPTWFWWLIFLRKTFQYWKICTVYSPVKFNLSESIKISLLCQRRFKSEKTSPLHWKSWRLVLYYQQWIHSVNTRVMSLHNWVKWILKRRNHCESTTWRRRTVIICTFHDKDATGCQ